MNRNDRNIPTQSYSCAIVPFMKLYLYLWGWENKTARGTYLSPSSMRCCPMSRTISCCTPLNLRDESSSLTPFWDWALFPSHPSVCTTPFCCTSLDPFEACCCCCSWCCWCCCCILSVAAEVSSEDCLRFFRGGGETPPYCGSCQEASVSMWTPWWSHTTPASHSRKISPKFRWCATSTPRDPIDCLLSWEAQIPPGHRRLLKIWGNIFAREGGDPLLHYKYIAY